MISLMVATLDANPLIRPRANINTGSKRAWYPLDDGLPQFSAVPTQSEFAQLLSG